MSGSTAISGTAKAVPNTVIDPAGQLLAGWRVVKFGDIAENVAVRVDPAEAETDVYVGLEHLDPESLHLREWGHPSDVTGQKLAFKKGDVIFGRRRAYQRKLAIAEFDGICSAHAMVLRAKPKAILPEFLPFFLQSDMFMERAIEISVGSLSPTINWKTMRIQEFPVPPVEEQKRIAEILWAADEAREGYIAAEGNSWNTLIALSNQYFPYPKGELRKNQQSLGKYCSLQTGYPFKSREYAKQGDRLLRCSNVGVNCTVWTEDNTRYWPEERRGDFSDYALAEGDLVIAMDRPFISEGFKITRISESDLPCLLLQRVGRFRPSDDLHPEYLWAFLHSYSFRQQLFSSQKGTDLPHISRFDIESTLLPVPSLQEQAEIAKMFQAVEENRFLLRDHISRVTALTRSYSQYALTGE